MNKFKCYTEYRRRSKITYVFTYEFNGVPIATDTLLYNEERWTIFRREWHDTEMILIVQQPEFGGR